MSEPPSSRILASDRTCMSVLSGDKTAWPVYLTLGNIDKEICSQPSSHASVLIGDIPVAKLDCIHESARSDALQLFHHCMVLMTCVDDIIRRVFPILFEYVADHPEQCLITCCMDNRCPHCLNTPMNTFQAHNCMNELLFPV
ncbi:hypothetical protein C8Q76DRAFT_771734 [Earliella scabrosa]|nr:hypothetical protein C8Q76DRAFT_771734 [Earliella scabrosa]